MKLSQPKSARIINTSRVLCALRGRTDLSKAELSRILNLNKVSTGEIIESLLSEGIVRETGRAVTKNGRRPTNIEIVYDRKYVLCVHIGSRNISTALCDLAGRMLKMERVPTINTGRVEAFCANIIKSCLRTMRLADEKKILGCAVTVDAPVSDDGKNIVSSSFFSWRDIPLCEAISLNTALDVIICDSTRALFMCEKLKNRSLVACPATIYVNWGNTIDCALVCDGRVMSISHSFGHIKASDIGLCTCGRIGCLEARIAPWAIAGRNDAHMSELWGVIGDDALDSLCYVIRLAGDITGAGNVIIGGEGSTISDQCLEIISKRCAPITVERSCLGDKATLQGACEAALDRWFYNTSLLDEVADYL